MNLKFNVFFGGIGVVALLMCASHAKAEKTGNGGQPVAELFSQGAEKCIAEIQTEFLPKGGWCDQSLPEEIPYHPLCTLDLNALQETISTAKLLVLSDLKVVDPVTGSIIEYAAENFPDQDLIEVSASFWNQAPTCMYEKMTIAFHEYLGVMKIEQDTYQYSSLLKQWLSRHGDPDIFIGCENEVIASGDW